MFRYLKYITGRRLWNEIRCRVSYVMARCGHIRYRHMPTFVALEPADYCMLHCPQCPVGMRGSVSGKPHLMDLALCRQVIDEIAPTAHTVIFHFQGEPLLNPTLPEMIQYAHDKRLFTMLSTNAQTLTPELAQRLTDAGLDRIIISMDGLTQATYEKYRAGGHIDRVLAGMQALAALPHHPEIVLQCLCLRSNEAEWPLLRKQYKALGADRLELKTAQFYDYENGSPEMPTDSGYCRYTKGKDGKYRLKNALHNGCYRLWSGCVITAEGAILPCCYDKDHAFSYGMLTPAGTDPEGRRKNVTPLRELLESAAADAFRARVFRARRDVSICGNCPE